MPPGNGGVRTKGRSLHVMSAIKSSIVTVKAALNCLSYALVIPMACVNVIQSTNNIVTVGAGKYLFKIS